MISYQKRELEEITYILSHDLKTPLRTINSFSELIQQKTANKDYNIEEYLDLVISSGKNLYNLVEDVILLHKVEQDKSESKKIDLSNVAAQVIDMFGHNSTYMNGEVVLSGELPTLYGNSSNFYIIFKNIIENGLKYNQSEIPRVSISSKYTRNNVELIFEDNGIGIEPEFHDYIFHYFKRLHTKEKYEGTGFGLGICKKIISKYNGLIKVESAPGKGSKFCVQFPAQMLVEKEMETSYST